MITRTILALLRFTIWRSFRDEFFAPEISTKLTEGRTLPQSQWHTRAVRRDFDEWIDSKEDMELADKS